MTAQTAPEIPPPSAAELYTLSQQAAAAGQVDEARRLFALAEQAAGFVPLDTVRAALAQQTPYDLASQARADQAPASREESGSNPGEPAADQAPPAPRGRGRPRNPPKPAAAPLAPGEKRPRPPQRQAGGRPRLPDAARTESRSIRLNEARWLKLRALGMDWLAKKIDQAHDPREQAAPGALVSQPGAEKVTGNAETPI